jgi:hypothetical protein
MHNWTTWRNLNARLNREWAQHVRPHWKRKTNKARRRQGRKEIRDADCA